MVKGRDHDPRACGHTTATQQDRASRSGYPREQATCKSRPCGQRAGRHRDCRGDSVGERHIRRGAGPAPDRWRAATCGKPDLSAGYFDRPEYAIGDYPIDRRKINRAPRTAHRGPATD